MSRDSISSAQPSLEDPAELITDDQEKVADYRFPGGTIAKKLFERRSEYLHHRACKIKIATWNVATHKDTERDISNWLVDKDKRQNEVPKKKKSTASKFGHWLKKTVTGDHEAGHKENGHNEDEPEEDEDLYVQEDDDIGIYVVCLQEVVDVSATENFLKSTDTKIKKQWEDHITVRAYILDNT